MPSAAQVAQCAFEVRSAISDIFMVPEAVRMCSELGDAAAVLAMLGM